MKFNNPDFNEIRVEIWGKEVHLVLVVTDADDVEELAEVMADQVRSGEINLMRRNSN